MKNKKSNRKGRAPLKKLDGDLRSQAQEGRRSREAWMAMLFMDMLSTRTTPVNRVYVEIDGLAGTLSEDEFRDCLKSKSFRNKLRSFKFVSTIADALVPILVKAWKSGDLKFFRDIVRTLEGGKKRNWTKQVAASLEAEKWLQHVLETPNAILDFHLYSESEIKKISGASSKDTAGRLGKSAAAFGLKLRPKGWPKKGT